MKGALYIVLSGDYTSTIKKAYRHPYSYRGGGSYNDRGNYGGFDISLLELDEPIRSTFNYIYLPIPNLNLPVWISSFLSPSLHELFVGFLTLRLLLEGQTIYKI